MKSHFNLWLYIFVGIATISCQKKESKVEANLGFCINDTLFKSTKIDTAKLSPVESELKLTGKITFNEDQVVRVFPFVGGVIEDLKVELGDFVKKGQVLAVIRSSEIVDYENQLISARSNLDIAKKNLQVSEDLFKGNLATEKDFITAQNEVRKAESEYGKIKKILSIYGEEEGSSLYSVKAPISGFIVEKNVTENMQFRSDNTENLFTISNLDNLWAIANVYETDISKIQLGQEAIVTTIAYPNTEFKGRIDKIFNVLDPENRVEKIKIKLENHENLLKPEMFAYALIKCPEDKKYIKIPSQAIIFNNSKNYVLVYKDKCHIDIKEVVTYKSIKGFTFIVSGLDDGDKIISNNQLIIYNALNN